MHSSTCSPLGLCLGQTLHGDVPPSWPSCCLLSHSTVRLCREVFYVPTCRERSVALSIPATVISETSVPVGSASLCSRVASSTCVLVLYLDLRVPLSLQELLRLLILLQNSAQRAEAKPLSQCTLEGPFMVWDSSTNGSEGTGEKGQGHRL